MTQRHILVTGGTGFIGSRLCLRLSEQGHRVAVITRRPREMRAALPAGVSLIESLDQLDQLPAVEVIFNLAGEPLADRRWNTERKQVFYASRVGLTERLFDHFSSRVGAAPAVLVSGSAIGYYGGQGNEPVTESTCPSVCFASDLCRAWESMASQFENLGTRVCRVRTGIVLGQGGALRAMLPAFRLGLGGPMGSGRHWMSWIHLDDMVAILLACMADTRLEGAINATAPTPVTNRDFAKTLGRVLGRPALLPMPEFVLRALFGELADELLLSSQRVLPERLLANQFSFTYTELEPALRSILKKQ